MATLGKVLTSSALVALGVLCFASEPVWVLKNPAFGRVAKIESVDSESPAELITIDTGSESKLQIGALCDVIGEGGKLTRATIVEATSSKAVAMLEGKGEVRKGDRVSIILHK